MLTEVKAYSSWRSAPTLPLGASDRAETDLIQLRNIDGLDPVKASVNTSPYGSVDGASYTGASVLSRNIVLTLHPNPNWDTWTYESLRRLLYSYFMPKRAVKLAFYSDDMVPVEISGIVEDVSVNIFSKDPELLVSVICPDPYFTAINPIVLTGQANDGPEIIDYNGSVETGMHVTITYVSGTVPTLLGIKIGNPAISVCTFLTSVTASMYFELNSVQMQKYVQNVEIGTGIITNLLSKLTVQEGSAWPVFQPGENEFFAMSNLGVQDWELTYFERFGGL